MAERAKSLVDLMKDRISNTGGKKSSFFYLRADKKVRIRFLQDLEDGVQITFHDKWGEFNHPCLSYYGKSCPNCDNSEARTADNFAWSVWNYESKKVEVLMFKANRSSPIPSLVSMYENYGTILDRDFVIERKGSGIETAYSVIPIDKAAFKGTAKPLTKKKILELAFEAFPPSSFDIDEDEDEEEEIVVKKVKAKTKAKKVIEEDEDYGEEEEEDEDEDDVPWDDDDDEEDEEEEVKPVRRKKK